MRNLVESQRSLAFGVEDSRKLGDRGQRILFRGVGRHDIGDVGHAGDRELRHVLGLAKLLGGVVLERHLPVGCLGHQLHERLGHQFVDDVPGGKAFGEAQRDFFLGNGGCSRQLPAALKQ